MATEIDSLEIKINAKAKSAEDSIDTLVRKLDVLSTSLSKVNGSSLSGLASGVQRLGNATKTLQGVKASDYTRIAKGFQKFAEVDGNKLTQTAGGLNTLAGSLMLLSNVRGMENVTSAINAIKNLARVDMSGFDTTKMDTIATTVSNFATQLSSVSSIESSVVRLVSAMGRLSGSGQYIENVTTHLPTLGTQVVQLVSDMSAVGTIDVNIAKLVDGIARLASAGKKVKDTVSNLEALGNGVVNLLNKLQSAPSINTNLANTIQGLGNIANSGSRAGTVTNNLSNSAGKATNMFKKFHGILNKTNKSSKGLASAFGMFYAKFFLIIRGIKKFGGAVENAQDYIEEFNYFSVAMDKIGKDSADQYKKAGYDSAESYAKSFRERFSKLQKQMTGYDVDYDTGEATSQLTHNLGLDLTEIMNYNAAISQITNSAGMLGETSVMTSKALSMLSADWSSLSNQDLSAVMDNFQSALIGQSRAVYKYGIDTTSAGLAQTALNHGIATSVKNMSQQSKIQLRLLTILEQSKVAYGDLARTINQPANQLRMLQAGFKKLSTTIGNIFMPIVEKVYPYLNAMVMVLQEFAQWIAKLTGAKISDSDTSFSTPDYEPAEEGSATIADNTAKAAKSAKKLSDNLQGFDIINKLDDNSDDDTGSGDTSGTGGNSDIDLSKDIANALGKYEEIWDKAFKSNQNKAVQLANKIKNALLSGWKTGDYSKVGKALANWINNGLGNIPWKKIKNTLENIAKSISSFLNGYIKGLDWKLVGKTLANAINTIVGAGYTFVTTFDWLSFGKAIQTGLTSAVENFDATEAGKLLGASLRGMIQFAFGLMVDFPYKTLGTKISDYINGFLEDMGKVDKKTGLTGWQELGKTINDSINGILTTISTALSTVDWTAIGKAVGQFLGEINWGELLVNVGNVITKALGGIFKASISAIAENPKGMLSALSAVFTAVFAYKKISGIFKTFKMAKTIKTLFGGATQTGLLTAKIGTNSVKKSLSSKLFDVIKSKGVLGSVGNAFSGVFAAVLAGNAIGDMINQAINADNFMDDFALEIPVKLKANAEDVENSLTKVKNKAKKIKKDIESSSSTKGTKGKKNANKSLKSQKNNIDKQIESATNSYNKYKKELEAAQTVAKNIGKTEGKNSVRYKQQQKILATYARKVNATSAELDVLKSTKKSLSDQIGKNNTAISNAKVKTNDYSTATKNLKNKMANLGIKGEEVRKTIKGLKNNLENGEVSWENYKKVVDGNYSSVEQLKTAISNLTSKSVSVTANVSGTENAKNVANAVSSLPDSKNVSVGVNTSDAETKVKKLLGTIQKKATLPVMVKYGITKEEKAKLANIPKPGGDYAFNNVLKNTGLGKLTKYLDSLPVYATGGFPEDGLFMANHSELVGKFSNGKTAVANNEQITQGFADGITKTLAPAIYSAVKQAVQEMPTQGNGDVYLDGKKISDSVVGHINKISRSRGNSPLWGVN